MKNKLKHEWKKAATAFGITVAAALMANTCEGQDLGAKVGSTFATQPIRPLAAIVSDGPVQETQIQLQKGKFGLTQWNEYNFNDGQINETALKLNYNIANKNKENSSFKANVGVFSRFLPKGILPINKMHWPYANAQYKHKVGKRGSIGSNVTMFTDGTKVNNNFIRPQLSGSYKINDKLGAQVNIATPIWNNLLPNQQGVGAMQYQFGGTYTNKDKGIDAAIKYMIQKGNIFPSANRFEVSLNKKI